MWYDSALVGWCLGLIVPVWLVNTRYGQKTLALSRGLHDELEREINVIQSGDRPAVGQHYRRLAAWRIELSDGAAANVALTELFVLGLIAAARVRICSLPNTGAGDILAVLRYVLLFISGLDCVPSLVKQLSHLRDIARRLSTDRCCCASKFIEKTNK